MPDFQNSRPRSGPDVDRRTPSPDDYVTHAELDQRLAEGRAAMIKHFDARFDDLERLLRTGFPNGDPAKHREAHEGLIQEAADSKALWRSVKEKTITSGVWAALGMLLLAVWEYVKAGVHK